MVAGNHLAGNKVAGNEGFGERQDTRMSPDNGEAAAGYRPGT
jgi:hypothetical protein